MTRRGCSRPSALHALTLSSTRDGLRDTALASLLIATAALARQESRGAHSGGPPEHDAATHSEMTLDRR